MRSMNERTLRTRARKLGYAIHKSRSRSINEDNLGKYALVREDSRWRGSNSQPPGFGDRSYELATIGGNRSYKEIQTLWSFWLISRLRIGGPNRPPLGPKLGPKSAGPQPRALVGS